MTSSDIETRLAVAETKVDNIEDDVKEIKDEVHEINSYIRNELINQVKKSSEKYHDLKQERLTKLKIWGTFTIASSSLIITFLTVFHII